MQYHRAFQLDMITTALPPLSLIDIDQLLQLQLLSINHSFRGASLHSAVTVKGRGREREREGTGEKVALLPRNTFRLRSILLGGRGVSSSSLKLTQGRVSLYLSRT